MAHTFRLVPLGLILIIYCETPGQFLACRDNEIDSHSGKDRLMTVHRVFVFVLGAFGLLLASCASSGAEVTPAQGAATVVVTTNILGDVVTNLVGDQVEIVTIMPVGSDPHEFQASAQQVAQIESADAIVANGAGFEEGLLDVIEAQEAAGVPVFEAMEAIEPLEFGEDEHDEHGDDEHSDDHSGADPHFFTDPARMAIAAEGIVTFLAANIEGLDEDDLDATSAGYITELRAVDAEVAEIVDVIAPDQRVLVTNHEVFSYFAERYGFEVVGTVVPGGSTLGGASAQVLADLAEDIEREGVPAIFADTSSSDELAQTLATEVGEVEVVELYSESLGSSDSDGATYVQMTRTNAERIAAALAG